jgi:septal ring factor EnvC (AmiA/AmiB activator)
MLVTRRLIDERTYTITNRDQKSKTVLIEHPYRADWKLAEPGEPSERTREVYRFPLTVEPGKRATLRVKETKPLQEMVLLLDAGFDQIGVYLQAKEVNPKVKDALQRVVSLRSKRDETRSRRTRLEQRIAEITAEHGRIRENMRELAQTSELYARYVRKLDQQETELEKLRKEVDTRKNAEEEQRRELEKFLLELELV